MYIIKLFTKPYLKWCLLDVIISIGLLILGVFIYGTICTLIKQYKEKKNKR